MSLRDAALSALRGWAAPDAGQDALRQRYVAHLEAHADAAYRTCRPDHLTAGALVVSADRRHVLLTLHAKAGRWFQFGGHCEAGDASLAETALREATEESGVPGLVLDPEPVHLDEHPVTFCGAPGLVHHLDVRWWPVDALPEPDTGLVARSLERLAQSTSWPGGGSSLAAADQPNR